MVFPSAERWPNAWRRWASVQSASFSRWISVDERCTPTYRCHYHFVSDSCLSALTWHVEQASYTCNSIMERRWLRWEGQRRPRILYPGATHGYVHADAPLITAVLDFPSIHLSDIISFSCFFPPNLLSGYTTQAASIYQMLYIIIKCFILYSVCWCTCTPTTPTIRPSGSKSSVDLSSQLVLTMFCFFFSFIRSWNC